MKYKTILLVILVPSVLTIVCCAKKADIDKVFNQNNQTFEDNRITLNKAVKQVYKIDSVNSGAGRDSINYLDRLGHELADELRNLGINRISVRENPDKACHENYTISFNIGNIENKWNIDALRLVRIVYLPCDFRTEKGYHYNDGYHRDTWGQGDGFLVYSDTDWL